MIPTDIVAWGKPITPRFLLRFSEFHQRHPAWRWVRSLVKRVDPIRFGWTLLRKLVSALWPDRHDPHR